MSRTFADLTGANGLGTLRNDFYPATGGRCQPAIALSSETTTHMATPSVAATPRDPPQRNATTVTQAPDSAPPHTRQCAARWALCQAGRPGSRRRRWRKSSAFIAPTTQNNPSAAASSGARTSNGTGVSTW
jgi:hypothetical protein